METWGFREHMHELQKVPIPQGRLGTGYFVIVFVYLLFEVFYGNTGWTFDGSTGQSLILLSDILFSQLTVI